jgi:integrase
MARPAKESRANFVAGKVDAYSDGDHGFTVRVFVDGGRVKMRGFDRTNPRKQRTLFEAVSPSLRAKAAEAMDATVKRLRERSVEVVEARAAEGDADTPPRLADLTVGEACYWYMRRVPGFPRHLMRGTGKDLAKWYRSLPEETRSSTTTPSLATLLTDRVAFNRLFTSREFAFDRLVAEIEPGDATSFAADRIVSADAAGCKYSPRTMANTTDRLSSVFEYIMAQHRRSVGLLYNPIKGRRIDRSVADVPEYTDAEIHKLRAAGRQMMEKRPWYWWRFFAYLEVSSSGRRRGSILGLRGDDHDFEAGTVKWRAATAKGENYGRGDEVMPMTKEHRAAVLWAVEHYPNPLGVDGLVFWMKSDPTRHTTEAGIAQLFAKAETQAGVDHIQGRATHSMRRAMATVAAEQFGDGAASEFVGMTVTTLRKYGYKKKVEDTMRRVAEGIGTNAFKNAAEVSGGVIEGES